MKKITLIAALFFPFLANAAMSITTNEQVSQSLKSDVLQGNLSFEEQSKNSHTIKEHLNAIVAEVKKFDPKGEFCQGGGYHLFPRYNYKDQKQEFIGYSGNLNFGCEFKTIEEYNALLAKIDKVSVPSVRKSEGALSWGVSEKTHKAVKQSLRLELLRTAKAQSEAFSKETGWECSVESVNFGGVAQPRPMMMKAVMMADSAPTESPIRRDEASTLDATVSYICSKRVP
jgi:uncharacterized protein YggE